MEISLSNKYSIIGNKKASILVHFFFCPSYSNQPVLSGSWFVFERWIADSPFQHAFQPAQSDLDIARGINAKHILERHWDTWMTEEDWAWISERGINTVRIPVGCFFLSIKVILRELSIDWLLSSLWS
jgi:aryl-phospho-beta-D-glucosidase BglC (GH1 family)